MNYCFETAFCNKETRQFLFQIEDSLLRFLQDPKEDKFYLSGLNSYERMLIHSMAECYYLNSSSSEGQQQARGLDKKPKKFDGKNHERGKSRDLTLFKTEKTRPPILSFRDYFTQGQLDKHAGVFPAKSPENHDSPEIDQVVKKGRGKMRYVGVESFANQPANNASNSGTNGTSSTSSGRNVQCVKEISQFSKEFEEQEGIKNAKPSSSSSQNELSKNYAHLMKKILTGNQDKSKEKPLGRKVSEEKAKSQDSIEETKEMIDFSEKATTSQRALEMEEGPNPAEKGEPVSLIPTIKHILIVKTKETLQEIAFQLETFKDRFRIKPINQEYLLIIFDKIRLGNEGLELLKSRGIEVEHLEGFQPNLRNELMANEFLAQAENKPKRNKDVARRMIRGHLNLKPESN